MRLVRRRLLSVLMALMLLVQQGAIAAPVCMAASGLAPDRHHEAGHGDHPEHAAHAHFSDGSDATGLTVDTSSRPVRTPNDCVSAAHCGANLAASASPVPEVRPSVRRVEELLTSWFPHTAASRHDIPPPKA